MAASGAKLMYHRNTNNNTLANIEYLNVYPSGNLVNNMEDDVIDQLRDTSVDRRLQALDDLRSLARRNGGRFPFQNQRRVFDAFYNVVYDTNQEVRSKCIQLLHELIPQYGDNLDECMAVVLPRLIPNLGNSTVATRRAVVQTLHVYMKYTGSVQQLLHAIVQYGLEHQDPKVKKEVIIAVPMLLTPEFSKENFFEVAQSLAKKLLDSSLGEDTIKQHILLSLDKVRSLVGETTFNGYIQKLSAPLRRYFLKLTNRDDFKNEKNISGSQSSGPSGSYSQGGSQAQPNGAKHAAEQSAFEYQPAANHNFYNHNSTLEFGVVPSHIMDKLNDQTNFRTRAQAVEELKLILGELDRYGVDALKPNVPSFINYLNNLLDDSNFKITTVTLEILGILVDKLGAGVQSHLKPLISCMTKRMGDNKVVIRQAIMKVIMQLMHILSPKPVLSVITENLSNRNSRVRQETLNIVIASLLTFPSYDFDLNMLCTSIAHTLVDPKRQVRQAALECFAVIAQALGADNRHPLINAVDSVELSYDGDGVMAAVQARLTRRQLPKLNADRLVDYATPMPSSGTARGSNASFNGPDIDWILQGSSGVGNSARSNRSYATDQMELESVASSARSTPTHSAHDSPSHSSRRHPSAGKSRSKLPWEEEPYPDNPPSNRKHQNYQTQESRDNKPQVKPRTTWGGEEFGNEVKKSVRKKAPSGGANYRDHSPEPGSYRQIHMKNYKKQNSESSASPHTFTKYGANSNFDNVDITASARPIYVLKSSPKKPTGSAVSKNENLDSQLDSGKSEKTEQAYDHRLPQERATSAMAARSELVEPVGQGHPSFSQSWPDPSMYEEALMAKPLLSPIKDSPTSAPFMPDWGDVTEDKKAKMADNSPIPTRPTLARVGTSSKRKVPPIPMDTSSKPYYKDEDSIDSARDSIFDDEEEDPEMILSLSKIRNSATKKKKVPTATLR